MTTWRFSDGTAVHLGGEVEGASLFAQELRASLAQDQVVVNLWPMPSEGLDLDRSDPALLDRWLSDQMGKPYRRDLGILMTVRPDGIPPLPPPPWGDDSEPEAGDTVY